MKKNYRLIPQFIRTKLNTIQEDEIVIASIRKLTKEEIERHPIISKIIKFNPNIELTEFYEPENNAGSYSKKNLKGYKIKHYHLPKIRKTYYAGERPIFGDYSRGTFSLYIPRLVYPYDEIPPRNIFIHTSILDETIQDNKTYYTIKFQTSPVLAKNDETEILFNINILQENIGSINVFASDTTIEQYLNSLILNWEIFPPGTLENDFRIAIRGLRNLAPERTIEIKNSLEFLQSLNPVEIIVGTSGMSRYIGAKFSENLVVFENSNYGNAVYILFEDWIELSQLSRLEIQVRPSDQFYRVRHSGNWQEKVRAVINARRDL